MQIPTLHIKEVNQKAFIHKHLACYSIRNEYTERFRVFHCLISAAAVYSSGTVCAGMAEITDS